MESPRLSNISLTICCTHKIRSAMRASASKQRDRAQEAESPSGQSLTAASRRIFLFLPLVSRYLSACGAVVHLPPLPKQNEHHNRSVCPPLHLLAYRFDLPANVHNVPSSFLASIMPLPAVIASGQASHGNRKEAVKSPYTLPQFPPDETLTSPAGPLLSSPITPAQSGQAR